MTIRRRRRSFRLRCILPFIMLILYPDVANSVRCYCTDDHCIPYGVCESTWCLVGIRRDSNTVIRTCGTDHLSKVSTGCRRNFGRWLDLCACDTSFCNTFAFLRQQIKSDQYSDVSTEDDDQMSTFIDNDDEHENNKDDDSSAAAAAAASLNVIFQRMDKPSDDYETVRDMSNAPLSTRTSLLTLLLVIVPLTVGATTILVVAANYYCHLC